MKRLVPGVLDLSVLLGAACEGEQRIVCSPGASRAEAPACRVRLGIDADPRAPR